MHERKAYSSQTFQKRFFMVDVDIYWNFIGTQKLQQSQCWLTDSRSERVDPKVTVYNPMVLPQNPPLCIYIPDSNTYIKNNEENTIADTNRDFCVMDV